MSKTIKFAGYELKKIKDKTYRICCDLSTSEMGLGFEIYINNNRYHLNFYYAVLSDDPFEEVDFDFKSFNYKSLELLEKKFKKLIVPKIKRYTKNTKTKKKN